RTVVLDLPHALDLVHVGTVRAQVRDYLFEKAATDWVQVGSWEVTNRFACDPRWSHMNGRGKGTAALWNKLAFNGDFTLEYYAGMRMRQGEMHEGAAKMYYPRVGDINVAFGAKDMDLFSGYNVILQGWDPMWTETWSRFMRGSEIMAKNDRHLIPRGRHQRPKAREIEVAWDPGGRPVHGAWYYVKIRKTGGQFDVSFDNVPVFSVTDRDPLAGQRLALWTQHNSIVIARAKVAYRQATRPTPKVETKALAEPEARLPAPYRLRGLTQPGMLLDFESDSGGLLPFAGDQSAELRLVSRPKGEGQALRLENLYGGGDFGVAIPVHDMDATRLSRIEFDYAMPPEAKLNLYVSLAERPHERWFVTLSGPDKAAPNVHRLGTFEGANADGKWHHASFDLGAALRRALPQEGPLHIRGLAIAMLHEGYLNAGLGGNPQGVTWHLDNLLLRSHGPKQSLFAWTPLTTPAPTRYRAWFAPGNTPTPMPAAGEVRTGDSFTVDLPAAGDWLVQAAVEIAGQWRPVPPVPVRVCEPVQVARTEPADKGTWDGGVIRVFLKPGQRANLDLSRCALKLGDARIPAAEHLARYDEEKGMLEFFANPARLQVATATETALEFVYTDDLLPTPLAKKEQEAKVEATVVPKEPAAVEVKAGGGTAVPVAVAKKPEPRALPAVALDAERSHKWTMSLPEDGDKVAPSLVRLNSDSYRRLDFEDGLGVLPLVGSEVLLQRVPRGDGHALRVVNRLCGSPFGAQLGWSGFDLGQNPILEFDYRITEDANVGFQIALFGRKYIVSLTDTDETTTTSLGQIPDVVADGTWQHARVDLTALVAASGNTRGRARSLDVGGIFVGDFGYAGDAPGAWYELDNLCLSRMASASKGLELRWGAHDAGGIAGYSYSWDDQPGTDPDTTPETASGSATFGKLPEGRQFFHIRGIDRAGNAGPTSHYPFIIDNTPPEIVASSPVDGSKDAASELSVTFGESVSQINTGSAQIFVNKRRLPVRTGQTEWDPEKRKLTVDLLADWNLMSKPLKDGQEMSVRISGLKDFAGNQAEPFEFSWKVDYSQDKEPPPAPYLWSSNGQFQAFDHFGNARHTWRPYVRGAAATSSAERVQDEGRGGWCLRVRKDEAGSRFGIHNYRSTNIETSPQMAFDIRIMPGTKVNALFYVDKKYYAVRLTGGDKLPIIGEAPEVTDDGKWHRVSFDAGKMLRKALPDAAEIKVRSFAIAGWSDGNEVGATFYLDNFGLIGPRPPLPLFSYSATDATGITKYRIAFDQNPASTAGEETQSAQSGKRLLAADKPGMWYVHAAARDGAGNWSETVHYPYLCTAPVPESKEDGLEATARWRSAAGGGRVRGVVYQATTMGGNRLMGLRVTSSRQGDAGVYCQVTGTPLSGKVKLSASIFSGATEPMKMHAVLKGYSGRTLTSESVELKPEAWAKERQFVFPEPLPTAGKVGERWSLSFTAAVAKRARPVFLFDSVQLASMPATTPGAGGE
ncbi:MAG: Ig-like domain-containing protein, partial [Victivallales bacterium]|nr:Ig-like domain-containing protein [Victivallales bacterium]